MAKPTPRELEIYFQTEIKSMEDYEKALERISVQQEMGIMDAYLDKIPSEIDAQIAVQVNPTSTPEQVKTDLYDIDKLQGQGQMSVYGGFADRAVDASPPFEAESAMSDKEIIATSLFRQQSIGEQRAQLEKPSTINYRATFLQKMQDHFEPLSESEKTAQIVAALGMYDNVRYNNPDLSNIDVYNETIKELNSLYNNEVEYLSALEADPRAKQKYGEGTLPELFANAMDFQNTVGQDIPIYTDAQLVYLQEAQKAKYDPEIKKRKEFIKSKNTYKTAKAYSVQLDDGNYMYVPVQAFNYIRDNPSGGVVYDVDTDFQILTAMREEQEYGVNPKVLKQRGPQDPFTVDLHSNLTAQNAVARVTAYEERGNPNWYESLEKRKKVLENFSEFDKYGAFVDQTATGGTAETTLSWVLRSSMSPLAPVAALGTTGMNYVGNTVIGVGAEGLETLGVIPEADYIDPMYTDRLREEARPPLYQGYGQVGAIADNIARFKGFTGEGIDIAEQMNLEGVQKWGTIGGYFITDIFDPSFDVASGTVQGINQYQKSIRTHRLIHSAGGYDQALKVATNAFLEEQPTVTAAQVISKRFGSNKIPKDARSSDVLMTMSDNVARNLNAERLARQGVDLDELSRLGFDDTEYVNLVRKSNEPYDVAVQNSSTKFRSKLRQDPKTNEMLKSYDESQKLLEKTVQSARQKGLDRSLKELDTVDTLADKQAIKLALKQSVDEAEQLTSVQLLENTQKKIDAIYGRAMTYEIAPNVKALNKASWMTPNTIVERSRIPKIIAKAAQTKVGKGIAPVGNLGDEAMVMRLRPATEEAATTTDVLGKAARIVDEYETAFDLTTLTNKEIVDLQNAVDSLQISKGLRTRLTKDIQDRIISLNDYNNIVHLNTDAVARFDTQAATIADINRLQSNNRVRLLEGSGSVNREVNFAQSTQEFIDKTFSRKAYKDRQQLAKQMNNPVLPTQSTLQFEQQRLLSEFDAEMGTFAIRSEELFKELTNNTKQIVSKYIDPTDTPLASEEVLSLMIVGERQSSEVGKLNQQLHVVNSSRFLIDNLFISKATVVNPKYSQADKVLGIDELYKTNLWNGHGKLYVEQQLQKLSQVIQDQPLSYWSELQKVVDDLNDAIQSPTNRTRPVEIQTEKGIETIDAAIVGNQYTAKNVKPVTSEVLNQKIGNLGLPTYYVAESDRVVAKLLNKKFASEFVQLNVKELFPDVAISQSAFEDLVKTTTAELYTTGKVSNNTYNISDQMIKADLEEALGINAKNFETVLMKNIKERLSKRNKINKVENTSIRKEVNRLVKEKNKRSLQVIKDNATRQSKPITDQITLEKANVREQVTAQLKATTKQIPLVERRSPQVNKLFAEKKALMDKNKANLEKAKKLSDSNAELKQNKAKMIAVVNKEKEIIVQLHKAKIDKIKLVKGEEGLRSARMNQIIKRAEAKKESLLKQVDDKYKPELDKIADRKQANKDALIESQKAYKQSLLDTELKPITTKEDLKELQKTLNKIKEAIPSEKKTLEQYDLLRQARFVKSVLKDKESIELVEQIEKVIQKYSGENDPTLVIRDKLVEHAQLVLRNNDLSPTFSRTTFSDLMENLDELAGNAEYAKLILGKNNYAQMSAKLSGNSQAYKQSIMAAIIDTPESYALIKKSLDLLNQGLYVFLLGVRPASHVRNIITAPTIVYQTTGQLLKTSDISRGIGVVRYGQSVNSSKYGQIALKTKSGQIYTYGDLFKILQKSGVRNQFQFIRTQLKDGSQFVKELNRMQSKHLSDRVVSFFSGLNKILVDKPLYLQTLEDYVFRSAVLTKALEEGRSVQESAALARRSMFDYSDMPEDWNRVARTILVFSSFTAQNVLEGMKALSNPTKLIRYAKMLRAVKSTNAVLRSMNDDKQLPYQMYFPVFAQNRVVYELNQYENNVAFAMAPPIPAIDSIEVIVSLIIGTLNGPLDLQAKDNIPFQVVYNLIMPILKEMLPFERKYESGKTKPEIVSWFSAAHGTSNPSEIAAIIERHAGGRVYPRPAKLNEKGAVNGYIYPLDKQQRKKLYHKTLWMAMQQIGLTAQFQDYMRLFFPEGTTQGSLDVAQRVGVYSGLFSVSTAMDKDAQQERNIRLMIAEMNRIKKAADNATESAIYRDSYLIPSDEGEEDGKDR
jgi:hypothetical protein